MKQLVTARIAAAAALVALVAAAAPTASHAQTTVTANWVQTSTQAPSPRVGPAMAYDLVDRRTVLFGGGGTSDTPGDTWRYDGTAGGQAPVTSPRGSTLGSMASASTPWVAVMFAGCTGGIRS